MAIRDNAIYESRQIALMILPAIRLIWAIWAILILAIRWNRAKIKNFIAFANFAKICLSPKRAL